MNALAYRKNILPAILWAGLLAGTLDIVAALIHFYLRTNRDPVFVFQYIASSLFGNKAYSGETSMILAGAILHYLVAYSFTVFFFLIYPRIKLMSASIVITGVIYGLFTWLVMNKLVLPLTKVVLPVKTDPIQMTISILILIGAIGIPLAYLARKFYGPLNKKSS